MIYESMIYFWRKWPSIHYSSLWGSLNKVQMQLCYFSKLTIKQWFQVPVAAGILHAGPFFCKAGFQLACVQWGDHQERKSNLRFSYGEVSHYQRPDTACLHTLEKQGKNSLALKMKHITTAPRWAVSQTTHTHTWNSFTDVKHHIRI